MTRHCAGLRFLVAIGLLLALVLAALPVRAQESADLYVVQPGDTLASIAQRFGVPAEDLIRLNNLPPGSDVVAGQVIRVPRTGTGGGVLPILPTVAPLPGEDSSPNLPAPNTARNIGYSVGVEVNTDVRDPARAIASAQDLGVAWVKIAIPWKQFETAPGEIDLAALDARIAPALDSGLNVLLTLSAAPLWARTTEELDGPPTDHATFARFAGSVAVRYRGRIAAYEIWDQPNLRAHWNGAPLSAGSYVELLRAAYTAIKNVDPSAIIVSAGLAPTGVSDGVNAISDRQFLRDAYAAGLPAYADAIGANPFGWANPPDSSCCEPSPGVTDWYNDRSFYFRDTLIDYRRIMVEANDGARFIWVTRFGWGTSDGLVSDVNEVGRDLAFFNFLDEQEQADYIVRGFEVGRRLGFVGPMFASVLNGCDGATLGAPDFTRCYYSLTRPDGAQRPAYAALRAMGK
ncbi:MAG: LysM peptidoglycan-binding domain-containing protein [Anaerolineae bacterium]|nr:LysM peptidoglycan-binding domain-containing protein [Anaerolineae bacterium]